MRCANCYIFNCQSYTLPLNVAMLMHRHALSLPLFLSHSPSPPPSLLPSFQPSLLHILPPVLEWLPPRSVSHLCWSPPSEPHWVAHSSLSHDWPEEGGRDRGRGKGKAALTLEHLMVINVAWSSFVQAHNIQMYWYFYTYMCIIYTCVHMHSSIMQVHVYIKLHICNTQVYIVYMVYMCIS